MAELSDIADFALELASAARRETLPRWVANCAAEDKGQGDFDPVTEADKEAERVMRALIHERYPDHGIRGEEWPDQQSAGAFNWSLDPVDGTRSFICRLPTWVTLVAFLEEGSPRLGVIDAPCLDETYVGFGGEAYLVSQGQHSRLEVSGCRQLDQVRLSTTDPFLFAQREQEAFEEIRRSVRVVRYGHDGYAYARLAGGSIDLIIESGLKPHDYDALIPLIAGAGGVIGDWRGGRNFPDGRVVAAASRELFDQALRYLEEVA